ncbi:hypothetical protein Bpfe_016095 [Biomphalaria pfeifferi]|uniref:Uncharacterized protein n=1 Tax=Biomphalaria pfeifferi TaxID=112525 RepID=A0AAD8BIN1_BIOPF|nr:hypothetical protein Bpfe_016095 [Biomphalaria pfeifferi]
MKRVIHTGEDVTPSTDAGCYSRQQHHQLPKMRPLRGRTVRDVCEVAADGGCRLGSQSGWTGQDAPTWR